MSTTPKAEKRDACPLCRKPTAADFRPFCSPRCRDRDLLNWLGDGYRVPGDPIENSDLEDGLDSEARPPL